MGLRLLALLCLVGAAFAGPFQREITSRCSTHCSNPTNPKFDYEIGKKYVYEYRGENYITISGNRKQKATVEGVAEFHWISKCEGVLKLKNVRIEQKLSQEEINRLIRKLEVPVSFSYEDGKIERVCPSPADDAQSLNIKKGILSTTINTMTKLDTPQEVKEEDSLGKCLTKYTVKYVNGLEVRKVKDLKSCTNRHSSITSLITSPYDSPESKIHTIPVFPEEYLVCTQFIEEKVIKRVKCTEHAKIKPLKHRESIIQFEGTIELKLLSKTTMDLERLDESQASESITYNLEQEQDAATNEREVENLLREMCTKHHGVVDITVSKDFIKLVELVKHLPYHSLDRIHNSLKNGRICTSKKVQDLFLDTLPMAGSHAAVKYMVYLLESKEVGGIKAKVWPASLALIPKPTRQTVAAIVPLMKMVDSAPVLLGVSAMLHRFCSRHECDQVPEVREIVSKLNYLLGKECSSSQEDTIFKVLKAFGNIGYLGEAEADVLACAKDSSKSLRLRLAAIDAFRRTNEKRPQELLHIYTDREENFELRIAALSSVLKKADEHQIKEIKETAETENDRQVSGYAYTLINNMRKTSSPLKKEVKDLLKDIELKLPKVNYWENSKNIEFSTFSHAVNLGGAIEADIIHSSETKIPRSMFARFDVDVFDKSLNIFEVGVRAEGLERLIEKLIGLKHKMPKLPKWKELTGKDIFNQDEVDASLFIRTMNVEIFDIAASDLTAMGELIQIAELMTKLSHERKADFSHSFLFLNSKLRIPSVTGRSYSLELTGSATVALTANTKLNLLSFPRNADIKAHFQPSVNVEISTTVGIVSNKHRPDLKLVSRSHLESDMEAKFQIKDGHVALASLTMPSENVLLAKFSSDVIEIDANHHEKRVFDRMQKKIDYCFRKLERPLGISVCGKWEVPKPFITKTFPYIQGVGNVEFAIKKSDSSFSSYEVEFEIPKHHSSHMKYKASLDTPGSHFDRRFAAELDIKHRSRGKKELSLELKSPFVKAGGSGSYTMRKDLVEGSLELHSGLTRIIAFNASTTIASSRSRTVLSPSLQVVSILKPDPFQVGGSVIITKGRKQQIAVDIKTNKPSLKPITLKGIITKEGRFGLSRREEWKVSSDLDLRSPLLDAQIRSAVAKQSVQAQKISTTLSFDYKLRGMQKHSVKLTGHSQKSSTKINTKAQFEMSQFPAANWVANWDLQGELREGMKNDLIVKYGRIPEHTYVTLKHRSRMPLSGPGQCKLAVKAPQFNVDSELIVNHELQLGETPKVRVDADLRYKSDKHVKGLLNVDYESKHPLKALTKAEIEYPGGKLAFSEELAESEESGLQGKSRLQWREDKQIELNYKYQNHKNEPGHHYELETSLKVPSLRNPIVSKASLRKNEDSWIVLGETGVRRDAEYTVEARLNKLGVSHVSLKAPKVEGDLKFRNEDLKKSVDFDFRMKSRTSRHITSAASMDLGDKKGLKVEVVLDADRHPDRKILASTVVETKGGSKGTYIANSELQINDLVSVSLSESGEISLLGEHEGLLEASVKNYEPVSLKYKQEMSDGHAKSTITISKNNVEKAQIELVGGSRNTGNKVECLARAALKCLDNSFKSKEISLKHEISNTGSSTLMKLEMKVQKSPSKLYKAELISDVQQNGLEIKAILHTPLANFERQAVKMSFQRSKNEVSSSLNLEIPNNKEISIEAAVQRRSQSVSATCSVKSPFDIVRDVKIHMSADYHGDRKNILAYLDVNNARMTDIEISSVRTQDRYESKGQLKIAPIPNVSFQGFSYTCEKTATTGSFYGKIDLANSRNIVVATEIKKERESISATTTLRTPYRKMKDAKVHFSIDKQSSKKNLLFYVDANDERKGDIEISTIVSSEEFDIQGRLKTIRTPEISAHLKLEKRGELFALSGKVLKGTAPLLSTVFSKQKYENGEKLTVKTESFEKSLLDLQLSSEISDKEMKFNIQAGGQFSPISLTISSNSNDRSAVSMEISACRNYQESKCYSLKAYHKAMQNSQNYRHYKKITFDLEKTIGESKPETMGTLNFLLASSDHEYRSKILLQYQEKNLGYEVKVHRREHEHEQCSLDLQVMMPDRSSRVKGSILHSAKSLKLEIEALPNEAAPSRKFSLELKKESDPETNEISGYVKILRPDMPKSFLLTGKMQTVSKIPVKGKVEVHYSPSSWSKVLTLEITPEMERSGKEVLTYRLYRENEDLDASLKLKKESLREEDVLGYDWSYKTRTEEKKGGLSMKISKKKIGLARNIDIKYFSPSAELKIQSESTTEATSLKVLSSGKTIKEIHLRNSESCLNLDVESSGPVFKSYVCLNKREGNSLELVSIGANCRHRKCVEFRIAMNPEHPSFIDVDMEWRKEEFTPALKELKNLKFKLPFKIPDFVKDFGKKVVTDHIVKPVLDKIVKPAIDKVKDKIINWWNNRSEELRQASEEYTTSLKLQFEHFKEWAKESIFYIQKLLPWDIQNDIILPFKNTIVCFVKGYGHMLVNHIPAIAKTAWEITKEQFQQCLKKYCSSKTFCHDLIRTYRSRGLGATKKLVQRKVAETSQSMRERLDKIQLPALPNPITLFKNVISFIKARITSPFTLVKDVITFVKEKVEKMFGKFVARMILSNIANLLKKFERIFRDKAVYFIDNIVKKLNELIDQLQRDEDVRTAMTLIKDAKKKAIRAWERREVLAKQAIEPVQESIKENIKKSLKERILVTVYDPKEGKIHFKIRNPLSEAEVELLQNEIRTIKRSLLHSAAL